MFSKWCRQAGLENRTAHGIRKAVGSILAEAGCTQYQNMTIHGHSESRTSEIYTRAVERTAHGIRKAVGSILAEAGAAPSIRT